MGASDGGWFEPEPPSDLYELSPYEGASAPLELLIQQSPEGQVDAMVPVRWCITHELIQWMEQNEFRNPHVLIVVSNEEGEMSRKLVPLAREMTYVQFTRPGLNLLHATVVEIRHKKDDKNLLLSGSGSRYRTRLLEYSGDTFQNDTESPYNDYGRPAFRDHAHAVLRHPGEAQLAVSVPRELFAKEPPQWLSTYVSGIAGSKWVDQCHFRKKLGFVALPLTIIPVYPTYLLLKWVASVLTALGALLAGVRGIQWKPLTNPFAGGPSTVIANRRSHRSRWTHKANGRKRPLIIPVGMAVLAFAATVGVLLRIIGVPLEAIRSVFVGGIAGILLGVLLIRSIPWIVGLFGGRHDQRGERKQEEQRKRQAEADAARIAALEAMVCSTGSRGASLAALPPKKRTVRLRANNLKTKVCRPFAR